MSNYTQMMTDRSGDPSIPTGFDEEEEGLHPTHARVGTDENLRTQVWKATKERWTDWPRGEFVCCSSGIGAALNSNVGILHDLSKVFMRGKKCRMFRIKTPDQHGRSPAPDSRPEGFVLDKGSVTAAHEYLLERLEDGQFNEGRYSNVYEEEISGTRFVVYTETTKGVRTFSAAHLGQITPLSSVPKSWNVRRAMRAILAGQVEEWFIDGVYTDDYALDNARNFCRGQLEGYLGKARRIWEDPSGWKVWVDREDDGSRTKLSFNCHSFNLNTIDIDLGAEAVDTEWLTCLRRNQAHPADLQGEKPTPQPA
jgi:hypothetical protein